MTCGYLTGRRKKKVIKLGIPDNESIEDYERDMDAITDQCVRDWDEEDEKRV